jgi:hypothetical protein
MSASIFSTALLALSVGGTNRVTPVPPTDVELEDYWKSFEQILGRFKNEYTQAKIDLVKKENIFLDFANDIRHIQLAHDNLLSDDLRAFFNDMIERRLKSQEYLQLREDVSMAAGKVKAMYKILCDTNSEMYNRFVCPVCFDKHVDIFLDPCGHLICNTCAFRLQGGKCPTCRAHTHAKRMYSTC